MNAALQQRIKPHSSPNSVDITNATVRSAAPAKDSTDTGKTSFRDLMMNSNSEISRSRAAQKAGSDLSAAKTDEEFFKMLQEKSAGGKPRTPKNELDKDAFLKLFITQIQNQDPLNPDDSAKMAAQLAQFQGLEQTQNINKTLEKMNEQQALGRAVNLIDFVGKEIKLEGGRLKLDSGKLTEAFYTLDKDIPNGYIEVRNSAGVVVGKEPLGNVGKGEHPVTWNGKGKDGKPLRDGVYTFAVLASDEKGQEIQVPITSTVKVTGVDLQEQGGSFFTELGKVGVHEVASIGELGFVNKLKTAEETLKKAAEEANKQAAPADIVEKVQQVSAAAGGQQAQDKATADNNKDKEPEVAAPPVAKTENTTKKAKPAESLNSQTVKSNEVDDFASGDRDS